MPKDLCAKYYQENKERQNLSKEEKSNNMVVNNIQISLKM